MNNKVLATILGFLASLIGVAAWVGLCQLQVHVDEISYLVPLSTIAMVGMFYVVYIKLVKEDKSVYPVIIAGVCVVIGVVAAVFVDLIIACAEYNFTLQEVLKYNEVTDLLWRNLGIGAVFMVFSVGWIYTVHKRRLAANIKKLDGQNINNDQNNTDDVNKTNTL